MGFVICIPSNLYNHILYPIKFKSYSNILYRLKPVPLRFFQTDKSRDNKWNIFLQYKNCCFELRSNACHLNNTEVLKSWKLYWLLIQSFATDVRKKTMRLLWTSAERQIIVKYSSWQLSHHCFLCLA